MPRYPTAGRRSGQGPGHAHAHPQHDPGPTEEKPPLPQTCPQPVKRLYRRREMPGGVFSFLHEARVGREVLLLCLFFCCFFSSFLCTEATA